MAQPVMYVLVWVVVSVLMSSANSAAVLTSETLHLYGYFAEVPEEPLSELVELILILCPL